MAMMKAASPILLTTKAFMPALDAAGRSNQKPIRRYEQSPTPSQPTNIRTMSEAMTRTSMKKVNRLRKAKYRE